MDTCPLRGVRCHGGSEAHCLVAEGLHRVTPSSLVRRLGIGAIVGVLVVTTALALVTLAGGQRNDTGGPSSSIPAGSAPSGTPSSSSSTPGLMPGTVVYRDGQYPAHASSAPSGDESQSKVWFAAGAWWAVMSTPDASETHIFRLDLSTQVWQDTGTVVDDRPASRADVVWDGSRAVIAASVDSDKHSEPTVIRSFSYDAAVQRFEPQPDGPAVLDAAPGRGLLVRQASGELWLVVLRSGSVRVLHSAADALHWSAPAALPGVPDGVVASVAVGATGEGLSIALGITGTDGVTIVDRSGGTADRGWRSSTHSVADFPVTPAALSMTSAGTGASERLVIAARGPTARGPGANSLASQLVILVRDADGTWRSGVVARIRDHPGPPVVVADADGGTISVLYALPNGGGTIAWKRASIRDLAFPTGPGDVLLASSLDPKIEAPSAPRTPFDPASGMVVLASDDTLGEYVHAWVGGQTAHLPPGRVSAQDPVPPTPSDLPTAGTILADDTFSVLSSTESTGWTVEGRSNGSGRLSIIAAGASDRAMRLQTVTDAGAARACRAVVATTTGTVSTVLTFRLTALGSSDVTITSVRGPGGEIASLRVTRHGFAAYYRGATKVTTTTAVSRGVWYRSDVRVDVATNTFSWRLSRVGGPTIMRVSSIASRMLGVSAVNSVCVTTASASKGTAIDLTRVTMERTP